MRIYLLILIIADTMFSARGNIRYSILIGLGEVSTVLHELSFKFLQFVIHVSVLTKQNILLLRHLILQECDGTNHFFSETVSKYLMLRCFVIGVRL